MTKRILLNLLLPLFWFVCANIVNQAQTSSSLSIGQSAVDFSLKDLNGKFHSIKDFRGKMAVIVFISTQCSFSNAYQERLLGIAQDYAKQNVVLIGINSHPAESLDEVREHAKKHKLDFTILKDEGSRVADAYGAIRTPEVFVIDPSGVLRYHGRVDNSKDPAHVKRNDLREALDEMLAGKNVTVPETKSFGCPIKMPRKSNTSNAIEQAALPQPVIPLVGAASFVPQKKPAPKRPSSPKTAVTKTSSNIATLRPTDFAAMKDSVKGNVLVINFWATWCGPCVAEFPEFVMLDAKYRDKGVKVVGISADELSDLKTKVIPFLKGHKATFKNFIQDTDDPQQMIDVVDKEWPGALPTTFVFDKQGNLNYKRYGIIDRDELVAAIEKALQ